jgi:DNA-binding transcriptional LysR family regulator
LFNDLNSIRWFVALVKAGSLTRAAHQLVMPLPSLSRRLVEMEKSVGERLIHRSARKFELTELGERYFQHAKNLLEEIDRSQEILKSNRESLRGSITLTAPIDFANHFLADALKKFRQTYPEIDIQLNLASSHLGFDADHIDIAIRFGQLRNADVVCKRLGSVDRGIYGNTKKLPGIKRLSHPKDLSQMPFVLQSSSPAVGSASASKHDLTLIHAQTQQTCMVKITAAMQANVLGMVTQLTIAGAGLAVLPAMLAEHDLFHAHLQRVLPDWKLKPLEMFLLYRKRTLQPRRVQIMIEHLTQHFSKMSQIAT